MTAKQEMRVFVALIAQPFVAVLLLLAARHSQGTTGNESTRRGRRIRSPGRCC